MRKFTKYPSNYVKANIDDTAWLFGDVEDPSCIDDEFCNNTTSEKLKSKIIYGELSLHSDGNLWWVDFVDDLPESLWDTLFREMQRLYPKCIYIENNP